jgi:hypothetical protein
MFLIVRNVVSATIVADDFVRLEFVEPIPRHDIVRSEIQIAEAAA